MSDLGKRTIQLRKQKNMSQTDLAKMGGVSYAQIGRHEIKGAQPPAEVLKKIAEVLGTTVDYPVSGDSEEKARTTLSDADLLQQLKAVQQMDDEDKRVI